MSEIKRYNAEIWPHESYIDECDDGEYVKYEDYAALQQKLDAVLARYMEMEKFIHQKCYVFEGEQKDYSDAYVIADEYWPPKPVEVNAILNEVRAEGVEMFASYWESNCGYEKTFVGSNAKKFAYNLRAGSTEGGV